MTDLRLKPTGDLGQRLDMRWRLGGGLGSFDDGETAGAKAVDVIGFAFGIVRLAVIDIAYRVANRERDGPC